MRGSDRWLLAAVLVTVIGIGALVAAFIDISSPVGEIAALPTTVDAADDGQVVVAVARTPGGPSEWTNWAVVMQHLAEGIGGSVVVRYLPEEEEAAETIRDERVDIAFVCAQQYLDLVESGDAVGLCTPVIDGSPTSRSLLVARADSGIEAFDDLEGRVVAVSDKSSLGGYAFLQYICDQNNVILEQFVSELRFGDTMEADIGMLKRGEIDATVINSAQAATLDLSVTVIEDSPWFGNPPIIAADHTPQELRDRVVATLVDFDADELLPSESVIDGFVPIDEADYVFADILRHVCDDHAHP